MNDQILMENILLILKCNMEVYVHGTLEASNKQVHETLHYGLEETLKMQHNLNQKMTEYGWYTVSNVSAKTIQDTVKKLKKKN